MPPVLGFVAAMGFGGLTTTIFEGVALIGAEMALSTITGLLQSKQQQSGISSAGIASRGLDITATNATKARDVIYGFVGRCPGTIVFRDFTGANNEVIHLVIALAGHQVGLIGDPYLANYNESAPLDGSGNVVSGTFAGKLHCEKFLGSSGQTACATLMAALPTKWTANHRLRGIAYAYVSMTWDENVFNQGFPDIRFDITGKNDIFDPRNGTTGWSENPALCLRDYFLWKDGIGCNTSEVNDVLISAEASVCDELVALAAGGTEKRFTCNGATDLGVAPTDIVKALLSSCAGVPAYLGGQWAFYAAHWRGSVGTIADDDLAGAAELNARQQPSDLYNGVKGMFVSAANGYQTADFPAYYHSTDRGYTTDDYLDEDGGELTDRRWKDIQLPFTTSASMAQRLAKIDLESHRRQMTLSLKTKIRKFAHQPPDVISYTHARWGESFAGKTFAVSEANFALETPTAQVGDNGNGSSQQAPALLMNFTLREADADIYAWSIDEELPYVSAAGTGTGLAGPPAPLIAQQLISIPIGLQFAFNFIPGNVVDGYWIYKSASSDVTTARRFSFVAQSKTAGIYTFQDAVGAGVTAYYWVTSINSTGESAFTPAFAGATTGLGAGDVMTPYRPTTASGAYSGLAAAYDNNLSAAAVAHLFVTGTKTATWSGFAAISGSPTSVTLRVVSSFSKTQTIGEISTPDEGSGECVVEYSTDSGSTWTAVYDEAAGGFSERTDSAVLSTAIDLTHFQVRATTISAASSDSATHNMFEIWVEVVT